MTTILKHFHMKRTKKYNPPYLDLRLGHLADAFIKSNLQRFIHKFMQQQRSPPCKATASSPGVVRVRGLPSQQLFNSNYYNKIFPSSKVFYSTVVRETAHLIAQWMAVGFAHGECLYHLVLHKVLHHGVLHP